MKEQSFRDLPGHPHQATMILLLIPGLILYGCKLETRPGGKETPDTGQWARTVSTGTAGSSFGSTAVDTSGNVYAAGAVRGTGTYTFGTGVTAVGSSSVNNAVLIKYDSSGMAQWARTVSTGTADSFFVSTAVDASGNIYAAGFVSGTGTHTFAAGVTATGVSTLTNAVLVKYNSSGTAQWARTVTTGTPPSGFNDIAVDASGNIYAAGIIGGTETFTFATGVTAAGTAPVYNAVLVKYDPAGTAQWARTVTTGTDTSFFNSAAVDASGSIYASGAISGTGTYTFATGVTAAGVSSATNAVLVQYDSSGAAQLARTVTTGMAASWFEASAVDADGNVYASGSVYGTETYTFGAGVTADGATAANNAVLVKYDSSGTARWARTVDAGTSSSDFVGAAVDASGNLYAAGRVSGTGTYTFGTGVAASGASNSTNVVLVKYDSFGTAQWAQTVSTGTSSSSFSSVAADASGNIYAAGYVNGSGTYTFGAGITASGSSGSSNAVLVKYLE